LQQRDVSRCPGLNRIQRLPVAKEARVARCEKYANCGKRDNLRDEFATVGLESSTNAWTH